MTNAQVQARIAIERKLIAFLLSTAREAGWAVPYVHDGEERVRCANDAEALDAVFSVDESHIYFSKEVPGRDKPLLQSAYIVLGNDGWDAICDHSINPLFESEVMNKVNEFADTLADA